MSRLVVTFLLFAVSFIFMRIHYVVRKRVTGILGSLSIMSIFLYNYYFVASQTTWLWYLMGTAFLIFSLLFMWVVRVGETAASTLFEKDTGIRYGSGTYFEPNYFPIVREIEFTLGFGLVVIERLYPRKNRDNFHHHRDDRVTRYGVNVQTDSLLKADLHKSKNTFFAWLTNFFGRDGEIEYFRVGRFLFFILIIITYVGGCVAPAEKAGLESKTPSSQSFSTESTSSINNGDTSLEKVEVVVNLKKSPLPIIPRKEFFTITEKENTWLFREINGVKYFQYRRTFGPVPPVLRIDGTLCVVVPAEKEIYFETKVPPRSAVNMKNTLVYFKLADTVVLRKKIDRAIFEPMTNHNESYVESDTWENVYETWSFVDTTHVIKAQALPLWEIPGGTLGGVVCFVF